jgi:hypothetical protein
MIFVVGFCAGSAIYRALRGELELAVLWTALAWILFAVFR